MNNIEKYKLINFEPIYEDVSFFKPSDFIEYDNKLIFVYNINDFDIKTKHLYKKYEVDIESILINKNLITKISIYSDDFYDKLKKIYTNNQEIFEMPNFVNYLKIDRFYFMKYNIKLPEKLKVLKIIDEPFSGSDVINIPIKINYPNELCYISYYLYFNYNVDNLPPSIEFLIFGDYFNQPLDNLGSNLKLLCLGKDFSQPLDNLPNSLEVLYLSNYYAHELNNLPIGLKEFINTYTNEDYLNILIKEVLKISKFDDYKKKRKMFLSYDEFKISYEWININKNNILSMKNLPPNLEYIYLSDNITNQIDKIPNKIKYLKLGIHDEISLEKIYDLPKLGILLLNSNFMNKINNFNKFKTTVSKLFVVIHYFIKKQLYTLKLKKIHVEIVNDTFYNRLICNFSFGKNIIVKKIEY